MGCKSPSVERVADKTVKANEQIEKLESMIREKATKYETEFNNKVHDSLVSAHIPDSPEDKRLVLIDSDSNIKTEYINEFSLDKIANVVKKSLKAVSAATNPDDPNSVTSKEAIEAYSDVVNSIAEAAKSKSTSSTSLAYSMTRLKPGFIAFLYASSVNIQDDETFGKEAVTSTIIFHKILRSEVDLDLHGSFNAEQMRVAADTATYKSYISLQADLLSQLSKKEITISVYLEMKGLYEKEAAKVYERLKKISSTTQKVNTIGNGIQINKEITKLISENIITASNSNQEIVNAAINRLESMGESYSSVIELANKQLADGYF